MTKNQSESELRDTEEIHREDKVLARASQEDTVNSSFCLGTILIGEMKVNHKSNKVIVRNG